MFIKADSLYFCLEQQGLTSWSQLSRCPDKGAVRGACQHLTAGCWLPPALRAPQAGTSEHARSRWSLKGKEGMSEKGGREGGDWGLQVP